MKLRNAHLAEVDLRKVQDYCLSLEHPRGRHKALVFSAALGLSAAHADVLRVALLEAARSGEAVAGNRDEYGERFVVDLMMEGPAGRARVRSTWMIRRGEDFPRMTTCYVL